MAKITPMWLNDAMRGRADKTSRTYTKVDKITGRTYAVTLRNPISGKNFNDNQIIANNKFGALAMGVNAWVELAKSNEADAADKAQYAKFQKMVKSQHVYPTVRTLIVGKRYATVAADYSSVTITDGAYTKTIEFVFNARPLAGQSGSGSGSGSSTGNVTLTVSAGENGKVKIGDGTAAASANTTVAAGTSVQITAVPDSGYVFQMWSDGNTSATRSVTVNSNTVLNASFAASGEGGNGGDGFGDGN